jgi:nicotinamide mononucleotide transporter
MGLLDRLLGDLIATTLPEIVAVVLALAYIVLAVRRSLWCWPCAFVSVAIYAVLFARAGLLMQSALQLFYLAMAVYGWIDWRRGRTDDGTLAIETRGWRWHVGVVVLIAVAGGVNGWLLDRSSAAVAPYVDAFVTWASIATTWMVARRVLENWLYWIVIDLVAAWLYFSQSLALTSLLFAIYVVIAVRGHLSWRREWLAQRASGETKPSVTAIEAIDHGSR